MNASEIEDALWSNRSAKQYLVGVFAPDQLPTKEFPGAYIVNTDTSSQPGQHWVAFFTTEEGTECFDSFGENPSAYSKYVAEWLIFRSFNVRRSSRETLQFADNIASISSYLGLTVSREDMNVLANTLYRSQ